MTDGVRLLSVVVPAYNTPDPASLAERISEALMGIAHEIIFVDDGSPDARLWPALERIAARREHVRAVQLTRNFGQQAATLCGLHEARGDLIVTMDDDLQHDPLDIPILLQHSAHDVVIAQFARRQHHLFRRIGSRIKGKFDEIVIGKPPDLQLSSFRLLSRTVVDGILAIRTPHPFLPALVFRVTRDVVGVPVTHGRRVQGRSGYTLRKMLAVFGNLVISNSSILLRVVAFAGIFLAVVSVSMGTLAIYRKLVHSVKVQGWTSLFAALLFIGGFILIGMGIIGEYLIRIIESSEARPTYFVRRRALHSRGREDQ